MKTAKSSIKNDIALLREAIPFLEQAIDNCEKVRDIVPTDTDYYDYDIKVIKDMCKDLRNIAKATADCTGDFLKDLEERK